MTTGIDYQGTGTLWEGRFKVTVIDSECYIALKPMRANMAAHASHYRWSS